MVTVHITNGGSRDGFNCNQPDHSGRRRRDQRHDCYQSEINKKQGTKLAMPVVYYSQLMTVAYGGSAKQAGLDGHVIQPEKLRQVASW